jgi:hypothetical protein
VTAAADNTPTVLAAARARVAAGICVSGEIAVRLAMRWCLAGQVGQELPGVTDQASLTRLGERYGVLDPDPEVSDILSGGKVRLAVLARGVTEELMEDPTCWTTPDPKGDAYEGEQ